ncbi:hypothetical protein PMAYCL1PPCAC_18060, partial [Pristionchus mayeri]
QKFIWALIERRKEHAVQLFPPCVSDFRESPDMMEHSKETFVFFVRISLVQLNIGGDSSIVVSVFSFLLFVAMDERRENEEKEEREE